MSPIFRSSGVYQITNTVNGNSYVGSTMIFRERFYKHRSLLRRGKHHGTALQRAWDKYGEPSFIFTPILVCSKKDLFFYEQLCLDNLASEYNSCRIAGTIIGIKRSDETKAKISAVSKGRVVSKETRDRQSALLKGRKIGPHSAEMRAKMSLAMKGKKRGPMSAERKATLSEAHLRRWAKVREES